MGQGGFQGGKGFQGGRVVLCGKASNGEGLLMGKDFLWKGFLFWKGVLLMKSAPVPWRALPAGNPWARVGDRCATGQEGWKAGAGREGKKNDPYLARKPLDF